MKRLAALILLTGSAVWAGPDQLLSFDETVHRELLAESKGKVLLMDFWATWCAPCRAEMPLLVAMERKLRSKGFRLITVSADDPEEEADALKFLQEHNVPAPAYLKNVDDDDRFINAIDPNWSGALPALLLYDRDSKLARRFIGETDMEALEKAIRPLL